ncbi:SgcJ/EcaC family oxidoreductase [Parapusillimonas sp. JC17]|uniref:SgcJ/EcaC family oxidoreductase n=1 Tax=Parapusillimonas sp. JC17 TaxID=3445768 RepID=UPI003F9F5EA5
MRFILCTAATLALAACAGPGKDTYETTCHKTSTEEVAGLFDTWNATLQTGDPKKVATLYAADAVLLPTLSNSPRLSKADKMDYFEYFLQQRPRGSIDQRNILLGCNTAIDTGLYTFAFGDGSTAKARYTYTYRWSGDKWLITSHHSSLLPEPQ